MGRKRVKNLKDKNNFKWGKKKKKKKGKRKDRRERK